MSAFGAYPVDLDAWNIHYLVSSANKCIEGVPGFAFTIANRDKLVAAEGNARSWSFDLVGQWKSASGVGSRARCDRGGGSRSSLTTSLAGRGRVAGLESLGQFRFTPPVQSIMAFRQALREYWAEGGQAARLARYQANFDVSVGPGARPVRRGTSSARLTPPPPAVVTSVVRRSSRRAWLRWGSHLMWRTPPTAASSRRSCSPTTPSSTS